MNNNLLKMLLTNYLLTNHIYLIYMFKKDLALNNLQRLLYQKTRPANQPILQQDLHIYIRQRFLCISHLVMLFFTEHNHFLWL